jgi:DNA-binding transcriptional regulator/RsmH inhibitor MraZ
MDSAGGKFGADLERACQVVGQAKHFHFWDVITSRVEVRMSQ